MNFFHCNTCFVQPGPPKSLKFCLTSCGHTFCTDCLSTNASKCKICQSDCKILALTKDIPSNLQLYFSDLVKETKKIVKTLLIQNRHCKIYIEEYVTQLESKYITTKNLLDNKNSEVDLLKKRIELLLIEKEQLKRDCTNRNLMRNHPERCTPVRDVFSSGRKDIGSRSRNSEIQNIFKTNKANSVLTPSPPNDLLKNMSQRGTLLAFLKNRGTLRDNMSMLKPQTPGTRMNQTFVMSSKSPSHSKGPDVCSPGSWCSSVSSIKSPILSGRRSYFSKPLNHL